MKVPAERGRMVHTVGIVTKPLKPEAQGVLDGLVPWLLQRGLRVVTDQETALLGAARDGVFAVDREALADKVDLVVVLGGDGTLLAVARLVGPREVPILGVNLGGLGFLTEITLDELYPVLTAVLDGDFSATRRLLLAVRVLSGGVPQVSYVALNDAVITKGVMARIVDLDISVNDELVLSSRADGLILSTPTGSTAYCLSAGGPILHPTMRAVILVPICPHALTNRPLVLPDSARVEVRLASKNEDVYLTLDGQVGHRLSLGDVVEVSRAPHEVLLIPSPKKSYYQILRNKLKWGER